MTYFTVHDLCFLRDGITLDEVEDEIYDRMIGDPKMKFAVVKAEHFDLLASVHSPNGDVIRIDKVLVRWGLFERDDFREANDAMMKRGLIR
ncbi:hypothetical protein [Methylobacterium sp. Leaf466]|uniref:hypothetical protein n=1 Tax=Methylobacterium sp. Leaf466 TaxID=1736386 RepID=UPI0006F66C30|nr:hypothetical protein [Methylobacterium sp. Leaf466]KQT82410.1 hypothetical protein ASG59_18635 [Methylobacterium sp. Leaf466]